LKKLVRIGSDHPRNLQRPGRIVHERLRSA
jgi:hypothetical protein